MPFALKNHVLKIKTMNTVKKFYQSSNFWTSLLLLVSAYLKASGSELLSNSVENVILIVSTVAATINIISKIDWKSISWLAPFGASANSTNFFVQLYSTLTIALPFLAQYLSEGDFSNLLSTAFSGNWAALGSAIFALVVKILSSIGKPKIVTIDPPK